MLVFSWALLTLSLVLCAKAEVNKWVGTRIPPTITVKLGFESVRWNRWPSGVSSGEISSDMRLCIVSHEPVSGRRSVGASFRPSNLLFGSFARHCGRYRKVRESLNPVSTQTVGHVIRAPPCELFVAAVVQRWAWRTRRPGSFLLESCWRGPTETAVSPDPPDSGAL